MRSELETDTNAFFDLKRREIYVIGDIDGAMTQYTLRAVRAMDSKKGDITVVLCTFGGVDYDGWAIYDALRLAKNRVIIKAYGYVMSIGALILQAGDRRLLAPSCRLMIHNGSDDAGPRTVDQVIDSAKELEKLAALYHAVLVERSNLGHRKVKSMCARDTYISASEAVAFGLADAIITQGT